jgi:hypothetical protein
MSDRSQKRINYFARIHSHITDSYIYIYTAYGAYVHGLNRQEKKKKFPQFEIQ